MPAFVRILGVCFSFSFCFLSSIALAQASDKPLQISIPAGSLADSLEKLGEQSGLQIMYEPAVGSDIRVAAVNGTLTVSDALTRLLADTGLKADRVNDKTVVLKRAEAQRESEPVRAEQEERSTADRPPEEPTEKLEEIIVTATRRQERLFDVPQGISVVTSDQLADQGATQFRDFANTIPGLTYNTAGAGFTQLSIRGVTVGRDVSPTVGIYVDDVPYGGTTRFSSSSLLALDVGLFDLDRIEVLRGPQGTLYGASAMGGLLKYVTREPDTTSFEGNAQAGLSATHHGGLNYDGALTINAPVAENVAAVRASAYLSRDGGYVDNAQLGHEDVNQSNIYGGRFDLRLTPAEEFNIRIAAFLQNIERDGAGTVDYTLAGVPLQGRLDQIRLLAEPFNQQFRLISGAVNYDLRWASLKSITSYQSAKSENTYDFSAIYVPLLSSIGLPYSAVGFRNDISTKKFTQEFRATSAGGGALEWIIGGFYTNESSDLLGEYIERDLQGGEAPNALGGSIAPSRYREYAAYGDLTWHPSDRFDVTGGIRYAHSDLQFQETGSGLFGVTTPRRDSRDDVVTYLANARYQFNPRAMGYMRYATGYRPGGPNFTRNDPVTGQPIGQPTYEADQLASYEVGFRAETADRNFSIDMAAYNIDWNNLQISVVRGGFGGVGNAPGGASIRGAELALTARPASNLTIRGAFAYQDAELSEADPDLRAVKGERLPNVPRITANGGFGYEMAALPSRPEFGAMLTYIGERTAAFDNSRGFVQSILPDYTSVDIHSAVSVGSVRLRVFVRNLLDNRGQLSTFNFRNGSSPAILQPRTVGISASASF